MRPLLAALALVVTVLLAPAPADAAVRVDIRLQDVNRTGATGTATVIADGAGNLIVTVEADGLAPDLPHLQHLRPGHDCPVRTDDRNRDGYVSAAESGLTRTDDFVALTTSGDTTWASALAADRMPRADAGGHLTYRRTIPAADLPPGLADRVTGTHLVQYGVDANRDGGYGTAPLGESTFARGAGIAGGPEEQTAPVTGGVVSTVAAGQTPAGGIEVGDGSGHVPYTLLLLTLIVLGGMAVLPRRRLLVPVAVLLLAGCAPAPVRATVRDLPAGYPVLTRGPVRTASPPVRGTIPRLGASSGVVALGMRADGTMQTPFGVVVVGWFSGAPAPGSHGPAL